ncbi:MAG: hypothetical protein PVJ67_02695 [Candidatus Pacearchaeota archaeon]|jgi:hypothetical protein
MNKKFLICLASLIVVLSSSFISAAGTATLTSPVANGNYSTLNFTCFSGMENPVNASLVYNATGGAVNLTRFLVTMTNTTSNQSNFTNASVNIASLSDLSTYNFTCVMNNLTDTAYASAVASVTIDQTVPAVTVTNIAGVSYSTQTRSNGTFILNVSVSDTVNATTVFFNLTNASGAQDTIFYANRTPGTNDWINDTGFNISKYTQGAYTITVYANDSANNLNSSESSGTIYLDSVSPSSVTITRTSRGASSLTLSVAIVDNVGIGSSCTVDRSGASISGTGTTQTLTETGLGCSHSYSYIVTCTDHAGNVGVSSSTSFGTSSCSSSLPGGSSTTTTWTNTYVVKTADFEAGYSKQLSAKQRLKVSLGAEYHYVGVKSLTTSSAVIEVSSDPVEVTLDIGEDAKVDVDSDGFYDILVKLLGITNNKADVNVQKINEEVPEESESSVSTTGEIGDTTKDTGGETTPAEEKSSLVWLWWVIIVLVIVGIGIWFFLNNTKKK